MRSYSICLSLSELFHSAKSLNSIHVVTNGKVFLLFITEYYSIIYHIFFTHSSVDGHLGFFHALVIVNNAAINIGVEISLQQNKFVSIEYISKSGIAVSYGNSIFSFLRNPHVVFHYGLLKTKHREILKILLYTA